MISYKMRWKLALNFCTASTELHDLQPSDLIDDIKMVGGATMWQLAEDSKIVLTF